MSDKTMPIADSFLLFTIADLCFSLSYPILNVSSLTLNPKALPRESKSMNIGKNRRGLIIIQLPCNRSNPPEVFLVIISSFDSANILQIRNWIIAASKKGNINPYQKLLFLLTIFIRIYGIPIKEK